MAGIIEILKSKGKLGGVGLMVLGIVLVAMSYFKGTGQYEEGVGIFFAGLAAFGIRSKQG